MVQYFGEFMVKPADDPVTYEEIMAIAMRHHTTGSVGDSDIM